MLLLLIVVQTADAQKLTTALLEMDLRVTRIGSTGGWLGIGNVALMLGIDQSRYDDVADAVARICETRLEHMSTAAMVDPTLGYATTVEVEVGGAVMFGIPVERFLRIPGDTDWRPGTGSGSEEGKSMATAEATQAHTEHGGGSDMKLIVAVVKGEDVDAVVNTLLESEVRLTRINTTGGFLRKGNSTLLIGVPASDVDEVIRLVRSACPSETEASPVEKGLPMYSATVFVLDSTHFERV